MSKIARPYDYQVITLRVDGTMGRKPFSSVETPTAGTDAEQHFHVETRDPTSLAVIVMARCAGTELWVIHAHGMGRAQP